MTKKEFVTPKLEENAPVGVSFSRLDSNGNEVPDPRPMTVPIELRRSESMDERIRRIIQHSASVHAQQMGFESFEEADDFDIEDDPIDPTTPYEKDFDHAAVHAVDRGVVQAPNITPERAKEVKDKAFRKKDDIKPAVTPAPTEPAK